MRRLLWTRIAAASGQVAHVARRRLSGRNPVPVHTHDFAEVLWVERGSADHEAGGVRTRVHAGNLVLVRPAERHGFFDGTAECTIVNVAFPAATLAHLRRRYFGGSPDFFGGRAAQPACFVLGRRRGQP